MQLLFFSFTDNFYLSVSTFLSHSLSLSLSELSLLYKYFLSLTHTLFHHSLNTNILFPFFPMSVCLSNTHKSLFARYIEYFGSALLCSSKTKQIIYFRRAGLYRKQYVNVNKYILFIKRSSLFWRFLTQTTNNVIPLNKYLVYFQRLFLRLLTKWRHEWVLGFLALANPMPIAME